MLNANNWPNRGAADVPGGSSPGESPAQSTILGESSGRWHSGADPIGGLFAPFAGVDGPFTPSYRVVAITDFIYIRGRHSAPARTQFAQSFGGTHEPRSTVPNRGSITVALAAVCVAASGCTVANSGHGGYDPNTLRIVLSQEPPTLEPCESSLTSTGIVVRSNITEPFIERDPDSGDLQPLLATGWRQTSPTQWTFDIRDGVKFSDGAPFTAAGRGVLHRPGRQLRPAVQRRRLCVRRREAQAVGPRRQHPRLSAPRSRIRFSRCVFPSSRSCRGPPAPPRRSASRSAPAPTPSRTGSTARS